MDAQASQPAHMPVAEQATANSVVALEAHIDRQRSREGTLSSDVDLSTLPKTPSAGLHARGVPMNRVRWPRWAKAFLREYARLGVQSLAAEAVGVRPEAVSRLKAADSEFAAGCEAAHEVCVDLWERQAIVRAVDGWEEPVTYKGELGGHWELEGKRTWESQDGRCKVTAETPGAVFVPSMVRKYDSQLLIKLLQWHRHKDVSERTLTVRPGAPSAADAAALQQLRSEALAAALAPYLANLKPGDVVQLPPAADGKQLAVPGGTDTQQV